MGKATQRTTPPPRLWSRRPAPPTRALERPARSQPTHPTPPILSKEAGASAAWTTLVPPQEER
eukprot:10839379-Heterocapsa_arctica.AAC.1